MKKRESKYTVYEQSVSKLPNAKQATARRRSLYVQCSDVLRLESDDSTRIS